MQHGDVVADHGGLADHDGMGVIEHDAAPHPRARMDVDAERLGGPHLDETRHVLAAACPEPTRDPEALKRLKPLEEQQGLDEPVAGGVALVDRRDVRAGGPAQFRRGVMGLVGDLAEDERVHVLGREFLGHAVAQRPLEARMPKHDGMGEAGHQWLVFGHLDGFAIDAGPDRVGLFDIRNFERSSGSSGSARNVHRAPSLRAPVAGASLLMGSAASRAGLGRWEER